MLRREVGSGPIAGPASPPRQARGRIPAMRQAHKSAGFAGIPLRRQVMMPAMMMTMIAPTIEITSCSRNGLPKLSLMPSCRARKPPTSEPIRPAISHGDQAAAATDKEAGDEAGDETDDDPGKDRFALLVHGPSPRFFEATGHPAQFRVSPGSVAPFAGRPNCGPLPPILTKPASPAPPEAVVAAEAVGVEAAEHGAARDAAFRPGRPEPPPGCAACRRRCAPVRRCRAP